MQFYLIKFDVLKFNKIYFGVLALPKIYLLKNLNMTMLRRRFYLNTILVPKSKTKYSYIT